VVKLSRIWNRKQKCLSCGTSHGTSVEDCPVARARDAATRDPIRFLKDGLLRAIGDTAIINGVDLSKYRECDVAHDKTTGAIVARISF
jgi:hypothetical protein